MDQEKIKNVVVEALPFIIAELKKNNDIKIILKDKTIIIKSLQFNTIYKKSVL